MPILQLTYLSVINEDEYEFAVYGFDDLLHINEDISGLTQTRNEYGIGLPPKYTQLADISGEGLIMPPITDFTADYNGNDYTISDIIIVCDTLNGQAGLFGTLSGRTTGMNLRNVTINAFNVETAGGIAGTMTSGSAIVDSSFQGNINVKSTQSGIAVKTGGIVGYAMGGEITNCYAVGFIDASGYELYAGGIVGIYYMTEGQGEIDNTHSFVEITANAQNVKAAGVAAELDSRVTFENYSYLKNSALIIKGNNKEIVSSAVYGIMTIRGKPMTICFARQFKRKYLTNIVNTYIVKVYYIGNEAGENAGSAANPFKISNYRQLELLRLFSWRILLTADIIYLTLSLP